MQRAPFEGGHSHVCVAAVGLGWGADGLCICGFSAMGGPRAWGPWVPQEWGSVGGCDDAL